MNDILKEIDETVRANEEKRSKKKKLFKTLIIVFVCVVVLVAGYLVVNQQKKANAVEELSQNLVGRSFTNVLFTSDVELRDALNHRYHFYSVKSDFTFHDNGTVTWTRQYCRAMKYQSAALTDPVTTTETYTVQYLGGLSFDNSALYIVLESGDVLEVSYDYRDSTAKSEHRPNEVNIAYRFRENLNAPAALMDMNTAFYSSSNKVGAEAAEGNKTGSTSSSTRTECSRCSGTGKVTKHFGNSWNDKPGYIYGETCGGCGGTGYTTNFN